MLFKGERLGGWVIDDMSGRVGGWVGGWVGSYH